MSITLKPNTDGSSAIQTNGVDRIQIDTSGNINIPGTLSAASFPIFTGTNQSLNSNGYQKLPGGLIIQWGSTTSMNRATSLNVTLPIQFPNSGLLVLAGIKGNISGDIASAARECGAIFISSSQITLSYNDNVSGSAALYWIAIGY